jgi:hypothetical protein
VALRERHGISYLTVIEPQMEAFAPVVARLGEGKGLRAYDAHCWAGLIGRNLACSVAND